MITYKILKDGHPIGQAKGKFKAVEALKRHLSSFGYTNADCVWSILPSENIECKATSNGLESVFSIERE